jgi:hypothetical protein
LVFHKLLKSADGDLRRSIVYKIMNRNKRKISTTVVICLIFIIVISIPAIPDKVSATGWPMDAYPQNVQDMPVTNIAFNWTPHIGTTTYTFELALDTNFDDLVRTIELSKPAYLYSGRLDYSTDYFWRVRGSKPMPTSWSASYYFQTMSRPVEQNEAVHSSTDYSIWIILGAVVFFTIVIAILVFRTR